MSVHRNPNAFRNKESKRKWNRWSVCVFGRRKKWQSLDEISDEKSTEIEF